jgi:anti-sigma regulatory factor (Ser/Thr protein kinase)
MGDSGQVGHDEMIGGTERHFHHATLFYHGEDGFLDGTLPYITEAIAEEEPILVAVSRSRIELLEDVLGSHAEHVHFVDMHVLGGNPARIIPAWRDFLAEHAFEGRPVRGIGEPIWAGRSAAELSECRRHESLLNVAFDGGQAWRLLCPYDLDALGEDVIQAARDSHPYLAQDGATRICDVYQDAHGVDPFAGSLPLPRGALREFEFTSDRLGRLRRFVAQAATEASLSPGRTEDLVLAVNELATNSLRHGGGAGTLSTWREAGALLCEVRDAGHITEPLVGRVPPQPSLHTGRGLWVVNRLCDLVQIRSSHAGSVVRVHMYLT